MPVIKIKSEELCVCIKTLGAEIVSVTDKNNREYMWEGDPKIWEDKAPVLFPIVGRLIDGKYNFGGKEYKMGMHGFAQNMEFAVEKQSENSVCLLIKSNEQTLEGYPFDFEFRAVFTLEGRKLLVEFITTNKTDGEMYYSVGSHEGYAISGGVENYSIVLDEKETLLKYEVLPSGVISEIPIPCFADADELRLCEDFFKVDALIFFDMKSKGMALRDDRNGEKIHVSFPKADTVLVWKEPNAPFVCIEPWSGTPDLVWKPADDFSKKYRIRTLKKGESENIEHIITF